MKCHLVFQTVQFGYAGAFPAMHLNAMTASRKYNVELKATFFNGGFRFKGG
jgi:hypothetical protein